MTYQAKVYRTQGATAFVVDAGGTLNAASGKITLPGNLRRGYWPLDLFSARALSSAENFLGASVSATGGNLGNAIGGLLNVNSTPTLTMEGTASNQTAVLTWASGVVTQINFSPIGTPPDFNSATAVTFHALAERASDNASNNTIDFRAWSPGTTDLGTTGATLTSAFTEISAAISGLDGHPGVWNFGLAPGTHTNNAVRLRAAWIEWDRASS
jgi:hypothetical protein